MFTRRLHVLIDDERNAAIRRLLAAEPMPVAEDPADPKREILEARAKRSGG
jgi:hypothetical protein